MPGPTPPRTQALDILLTGGVLTKLDSAQQFRWRATGRRLSCSEKRPQGGLDQCPRVVTGLHVRRRRGDLDPFDTYPPERFSGRNGFVGERLVKFPQPVVAYV
jgi:hypothetical protein